ncbi:hypothetical protein [Kordia sp.]|uniref:hypothetical protein n=1 Tax=Kordia sp. TaxID=1965332 RepID=UPI003D6C33A5
MATLTSHISSNSRAYMRFIFAALFLTMIPLRFWSIYNLVFSSLIFFMLVYDLFKRNYPQNQLEASSYYLFWIVAFLTIITNINLRYNYFDSDFSSSFLHYPIKEILIIKSIVFIISFIRYRSIVVTKTILSKLWLVTMSLHFAFLLLNSTYSFQIISYNLAIISAIETVLIIFTEKELLIYKSSIFDFLWD